jgi:hypothetical protein
MNVRIVDSYKFISTKLDEMPEMFGFKNLEKEIMPYSIFNNANMFEFNKGTQVPIEAIHSIPFDNINWDEKKQNQFEINLEKWNCISKDGKTVNLHEYSKRYCDRDCELLYNAMKQFRQNIYEISRLDILTLNTAASISEAIMHKEGAFDDVVAVTGVARDFIQKCVVGGRVCLSDNEAKVIHGMIADLDGVSLYPSSMYRLKGYVRGTAKGIHQSKLDDVKIVFKRSRYVLRSGSNYKSGKALQNTIDFIH